MGGALAIPIIQLPGLLMGIASAFALRASADRSLHPSYELTKNNYRCSTIPRNSRTTRG